MNELGKGDIVVCPAGEGCGVDVSYYSGCGDAVGIVLGITGDGNFLVRWGMEELRHFDHELKKVGHYGGLRD